MKIYIITEGDYSDYHIVGKQYYVCDFLDAELKDNSYCSYGERK